MFSNVLRSSLVALAASAATVQAAATFVNCSADQQSVLTNAAALGHTMISDAFMYVNIASPSMFMAEL
jgi:hypothetical protein